MWWFAILPAQNRESLITSTNLDLEEFCVDVSTYEPVEWVEEEAEACETVFVKVAISEYERGWVVSSSR